MQTYIRGTVQNREEEWQLCRERFLADPRNADKRTRWVANDDSLLTFRRRLIFERLGSPTAVQYLHDETLQALSPEEIERGRELIKEDKCVEDMLVDDLWR
jgi:hypothetical protein